MPSHPKRPPGLRRTIWASGTPCPISTVPSSKAGVTIFAPLALAIATASPTSSRCASVTRIRSGLPTSSSLIPAAASGFPVMKGLVMMTLPLGEVMRKNEQVSHSSLTGLVCASAVELKGFASATSSTSATLATCGMDSSLSVPVNAPERPAIPWRAARCALSRHDEVEPRVAAPIPAHDPHRQLAPVEAVGAVARLVRKVQLRRQHPAARRLHLDVNVARAPRVCAGNDGVQLEASLRVGEDMPAIAVAPVVVVARLVAVPEVEQGARHRPALRREDQSREKQPLGLAARLGERAAPRRIGGVERARGLRRGGV